MHSAYWCWCAYRKPSVTLQPCYHLSPSLPRLCPGQHSVFRSKFRFSRPNRVYPVTRVVLYLSRGLRREQRIPCAEIRLSVLL